MTNLRAILKHRLLTEIIDVVNASSTGLAVMICDENTLKIMSSVLRIHEINDKGIGAVLNISLNREPLPGTTAVYFLTPTEESIKAMIADYADIKKTRYGKAFFFASAPVDKKLFDKIGASRITDFLQDFREVRVDFLAFESRVALFGRPKTLPTLFFPTSEKVHVEEIDRSALQLASLCLTLKELPYIRYQESSATCKQIAEAFDRHISLAARELQDWKWNDMRSTLLIVDRSVDPVAPLMHEYTYQAMVNDLLNVNGEVVTVTGKNADNSGPYLLSDEEDMYVEMRHLHISEVTQMVTSRFNHFKTHNATAKLQGSDDVKEMLQVAKSLPQYRAEMKKYTKHMTLAESCFDVFDEKDLRAVSMLEQDMATGVDEEGSKTVKKDLQMKLVDLIRNPKVGTLDKLRLIMIYIISQDGIDATTRKQLFSTAEFEPSQEEAVQNLVALGVTLQSSSKKASARVIDPNRLGAAKSRARTVPLELMRFIPLLSEILTDFSEGTLSTKIYRYIKDPPAQESLLPKKGGADKKAAPARSVRQTKWKGDNKTQEEKYVEEKPDTPRLIVFVAGGCCFSEVRTVYEVSQKTGRDIIIASTHTITAEQFIEELKPLKLE